MQNNKSKYVKIVGAFIVLFILFIVVFNYSKDTRTTKEITYKQFESLLNDKQIESVIISSENLIITPKKSNTEYNGKTLYTANVNNEKLISKLQELKVNYGIITTKTNATGIIFIVLPIFLLLFIYFIHRNKLSKRKNKKLLIKIKDLENKS